MPIYYQASGVIVKRLIITSYSDCVDQKKVNAREEQ
jgi:hypothetical protein